MNLHTIGEEWFIINSKNTKMRLMILQVQYKLIQIILEQYIVEI
jgi:hypothetical protein